MLGYIKYVWAHLYALLQLRVLRWQLDFLEGLQGKYKSAVSYASRSDEWRDNGIVGEIIDTFSGLRIMVDSIRDLSCDTGVVPRWVVVQGFGNCTGKMDRSTTHGEYDERKRPIHLPGIQDKQKKVEGAKDSISSF